MPFRILLTLITAFQSVALSLAITSFAHDRFDGMPVTPHEYLEIKRLGFKMMTQFPLDQYYYLAVGRSPTPVMAFIEEILGSGSDWSLGFLPFGGVNNWDRSTQDGQNASVNAKVQNHLSKFVPSARKLQGRRILLIDVIDKGMTLITIERFLRRYLSQACTECTVDVFGLKMNSWRTSKFDSKSFSDDPHHFILDLNQYPLLQTGLIGKNFKYFSPFSSFNPVRTNNVYPMPERYIELRTQLRAYMENDSEIHTAVTLLRETRLKQCVDLLTSETAADFAAAQNPQH